MIKQKKHPNILIKNMPSNWMKSNYRPVNYTSIKIKYMHRLPHRLQDVQVLSICEIHCRGPSSIHGLAAPALPLQRRRMPKRRRALLPWSCSAVQTASHPRRRSGGQGRALRRYRVGPLVRMMVRLLFGFGIAADHELRHLLLKVGLTSLQLLDLP